MAKTLFLNKDTWDITLDAAGRIVTAQGLYAVAQNVANAVRLFTRDAYFNQADGIPHFTVDLGQRPSPAIVRARINRAARNVPEVATASITLTKFEGRTLEGTIEITTTSGDTINVAL
ncbi:MAG: hypothetical protein RRY29_03885 [Desulfovibrionaceae bacterium]